MMIKKLSIQGNAKEIGYAHGKYGKQEVLNSLETYEKLFHSLKDLSWTDAKELALKHVDAIQAYNSEMMEEMEGIADGAGVDVEDVLILNTRSEIALTNNGDIFSDGCTSLAISSPVIEDTIIAQTWDWTSSQRNSLLLLEIENEDKPKITMVTEGGIIGKIGFNSSGVGVCLNALTTDQRTNEIPIHIGLRAVLNSCSQAEAIAQISGRQMASAANFLIGYDEGRGIGTALNAEVSPFGIDYVERKEGWTTHTNHICSAFQKQYVQDLNMRRFEDSILRKTRIDNLISYNIARNKKIDEQSIMTWLSDTFNQPSSINHSPNSQLLHGQEIETVFSIIMNLTKREAYLRIGQSGDFINISTIA